MLAPGATPAMRPGRPTRFGFGDEKLYRECAASQSARSARSRLSANEYIATPRVQAGAGDEADFTQRFQPRGPREQPESMPISLHSQRAISFPEQKCPGYVVGLIVGIGVPGPMNVAERPSVRSVLPSRRSCRLECLSHAIGDEDRSTTGAKMTNSRGEHGLQ